jgi:hypothetical protein
MSTGDVDHVAAWFAEDFKLHDPSIGGIRFVHDGARDRLRSACRARASSAATKRLMKESRGPRAAGRAHHGSSGKTDVSSEAGRFDA